MQAAYEDLVPEVARWRVEGLSLRAIAEPLDAVGHTTRTGASRGLVQVKRTLERAGPPHGLDQARVELTRPGSMEPAT